MISAHTWQERARGPCPRSPTALERPTHSLHEAALYVCTSLLLRVLHHALHRAVASRLLRALRSAATRHQPASHPIAIRPDSPCPCRMSRRPSEVLMLLQGVLCAAAGPFAVGASGAWSRCGGGGDAPATKKRSKKEAPNGRMAEEHRQNTSRTPAAPKRVQGANPTPNPMGFSCGCLPQTLTR